MVLADLLTATRYELNITVVVLNNESLQMERDKLKAANKKEVGVDLTNPDFVKLAEACGWKGLRATSDTKLNRCWKKHSIRMLPRWWTSARPKCSSRKHNKKMW